MSSSSETTLKIVVVFIHIYPQADVFFSEFVSQLNGCVIITNYQLEKKGLH